MGTMQHSLAEEARRPRQSSFGALSAGLIERGTVPPEVLLGGPEPEAGAEADAGDGGIAARELQAEREAWHARLPAHKLLSEEQGLAERRRTREASFGSLGAGMVERGGALSRQILSQAQIELLLSPRPVEHEEFLSLATEDDDGDSPVDVDEDVAAAAEPVVSAIAAEDRPALPAAAQNLLPIPQEPAKPIPTPQDFYRAAVAEEQSTAAAPDEPPRKSFRTVRIWATCLLLLLLSLPEPASTPAPAPALATAEPMPAVAAEAAPPVAEPAPEAASVPEPTVAPAIEAAEEEEAPQPPTVTMSLERARPGPVVETPMPEPVPLPPSEPLARRAKEVVEPIPPPAADTSKSRPRRAAADSSQALPR